MCEVANEEKHLLLLCGTDRSKRENVSLQLYDIEDNEWYEPYTFSEDEYEGARPNSMMGVAGSKIYFFVDEKSKDNGESAEELPYYCFDFVTKTVTNLGILPSVSYGCSDCVAVEDYIYCVSSDNVSCLDTIEKTIVKDLGKLDTETSMAISEGSSVYYDGSIYCIGPYIEYFAEPAFRAFDVNTGETTEVNKLVLEGFQTVALLNNKFYVIETYKLSIMAIYTPETDEWEVFSTTGPNIVRGKLVACDGRLFCVEERCNIYEYDFEEKSWNKVYKGHKGLIRYKYNCTLHVIKKCYAANWAKMEKKCCETM